MSKLLVVYNVCGLGREDLDLYRLCLNSIATQGFRDYQLCISSCLSSSSVRNELIKEFPQGWFNFIDDRVPVNISFNHSVRKCVEKANFDGYLYVSSDIQLENKDTLEILNWKITEKTGMVSVSVDNDNSFNNILNPNDHYIIKPGEAVNNHCTWFSRDIFDFYGNTEPDIFAGYSSESTFFYICAALQKNWLVLGQPKAIHHRHRNDGATSGFCHRGPYNIPWDNLFNAPRRMTEILADPLAKESGFGYEECQGVFKHDPAQFDEHYLCVNSLLKDFIRENLYLKKENFDYDSVKSVFLGG